MADKCIIFGSKQSLSDQNQTNCDDTNAIESSSSSSSAILNAENARILSDTKCLMHATTTTTTTYAEAAAATANMKTVTASTVGNALRTISDAVELKPKPCEAEEVEDDDEEEDMSERDRESLYASLGHGCSQNEKIVYLETPVLDDNNELLDIESSTIITATKPKRLSDEFLLARDDDEDDDDDDDDGENEDDQAIIDDENSIAAALLRSSTDEATELVQLHQAELKCGATIVSGGVGVADVVDDEISTCSLNMLSENVALPPLVDDSSSPHSSMSHEIGGGDGSSGDAITLHEREHVNVADVVEELTNQGDEHAQRHTENQNLYSNSNHDVQSMDAIERRDFEMEQKLTRSRILGNSALVQRNGRDQMRLNVGLINESIEQSDSSESSSFKLNDKTDDCMEGLMGTASETATCTSQAATSSGPSSSSSCSGSGSSSQLVSTPTTSRVKRSRFNINGNNLTKSLSKSQEDQAQQQQQQQQHDDQPQQEYLTNSNDSVSSDHQYAMKAPGDETGDDADAADVSGENNQCSMCSACKDGDMDEDDDDDEDADGDDEDDGQYQEEKPSTSNGSRRNRVCDCFFSPWKFGTCSCTQKGKKDVGTETDGTSNAASSSRRGQSKASTSGRNADGADDLDMSMSSHFKVFMADSSYDDWSCEATSDTEEVCTCRDYSDDEASSEDELPSRDVDLSCYSISEDVLNGNSTDTPTTRTHRKRKLTETRTPLIGDIGSGGADASDRKRIALEKCGTPSTPTTSATINSPSTSMSAALRTPRSVIPTRDNPPPELSDWLSQFQQWSHAERLLAVDRLIEHCEPTQVRHMMKVIEPQFQRDFISLLPKEVALQVLSFLPPKDLLRAAQTCRSWRFLCDDNLLWKEKCKQTGICIEGSPDRPKRGRVGNMPPIASEWKAAYMRQHIIEMNWRQRPVRDPKILKGHDDHVITCLQFFGNRIVSGSDDNTLKVWSAITGKCLRTLVGHTGGVWSSQMSANIIISGSTDRTLKVWNADNGTCIHTLMGHTSTVRCMHLHEKRVVSGSRDATLRVWDIVQGRCLHTLVGHLAAVRCVQYDGKLVVSGAYDYMVKVWNPETEECLHTLQGHTNRVYSLQFDGVHVVSGSLDTSIRVWDAATGACKHTLMGHQSLTSGMELRQNILVSGNADSTVKVWDITTGQCLQTLSGSNKHQSAVTCLQFNSRFVITSSDDGTVKLWDVRTGEFIRNLVALDSGGSGGVVWRIRSNDTKLICAVGSRNGTEETKLMVLDFDVEGACLKCS